jgi:CheY-like chemotaxis protein
MAKPASASRARILVVDDAPTTLEVLQRNLEAQGYVVFTASGTRISRQLK